MSPGPGLRANSSPPRPTATQAAPAISSVFSNQSISGGSMAEGNGSSHVTRAELAAHIKGIDERFHTVAEDVTEIKGLIEGIYQTFRAERRDRSARMRAWGPPLVAALIAAVVSVPLALFIH